MKNKGFTLTELIGVIIILSIIMMLGVVAFIGIRSRILERQYENLISYIETKAVHYAVETGELNVTVEKLIEEGYIEADKNQILYNPKDKTSMNCYMFDSKYENGNYKAQMVGDVGVSESGFCNTYEVKKEIQICVVTEEGCNIAIANWYNKNIKLSVLIGGNQDLVSSSDIVWKVDGKVTSGPYFETNISSINKGIYTVEVKYEEEKEDGTKKTIQGMDSVAVNIDLEDPFVSNITIEKENQWVNHNKKVTVKLGDNNGSGIAAVAIKEYAAGEHCKNIISGWMPHVGDTYLKELGNGKYNICIQDVAGNISEDRFIEIEYIDMVQPECNVKIGAADGENGWHVTKPQVITLEKSDNVEESLLYGLRRDNSTIYYNKVDTYSHTDDTIGTTYYGFVKDLAGNEKACQGTIYVDTLNPDCDVIVAGTKKISNGEWYTSNVAVSINEIKGTSPIDKHSLTTTNTAAYVSVDTAINLLQEDTTGVRYYGHVKGASGLEGECSTGVIKVDTTLPEIEDIVTTEETEDGGAVTISTTLSDNGSKLSGYAITQNNNEPSSWTAISGSPSSKDISSEISESGTYYVWAKDIAGNVSSESVSVVVRYKQTTRVRYETATGSWGSYSVVDTRKVSKGESYSWSTSQLSNFDSAMYKAASVTSYTVTGEKVNNVDIYRNTFECKKQYRLENLNGSWGSYVNDTSVTVRYGGSCSYEKGITNYKNSPTGTNNTASTASASNITEDVTLQVNLYLNTYTCSKRYRLQNLNNTWSSYTNDTAATARHGGSCTYEKGVTNYRGSASSANNTNASQTVSNITSNTTISLDLYLNTYTCSKRYRLQNLNNTWSSYTNDTAATVMHGGSCSYEKGVTNYRGSASSANNTNASQTLSNITSNTTISLDLYLNTYTCSKRYRLQNLDNSWTGYTNDTAATVMHGGSCSYEKGVTNYRGSATSANNTNASQTVNNITSNTTISLDLYLNTYTCLIQYRFQNENGGYGSYTNGTNSTLKHGQTCSWSRAADATYKASSYSTTITSNVSQQLNVDRNQCTVTFDSDGGSSVGNQTIYYGGKATKPEDPTKSGYKFKEWQLNGSTYDFNSIVSSDINLVSIWSVLGRSPLVVYGEALFYKYQGNLAVRKASGNSESIHLSTISMFPSEIPMDDGSPLVVYGEALFYKYQGKLAIRKASGNSTSIHLSTMSMFPSEIPMDECSPLVVYGEAIFYEYQGKLMARKVSGNSESIHLSTISMFPSEIPMDECSPLVVYGETIFYEYQGKLMARKVSGNSESIHLSTISMFPSEIPMDSGSPLVVYGEALFYKYQGKLAIRKASGNSTSIHLSTMSMFPSEIPMD